MDGRSAKSGLSRSEHTLRSRSTSLGRERDSLRGPRNTSRKVHNELDAGEHMKSMEGAVVALRASLRPNLTLTAEESLVLRGLVAGRTEKQVRRSLHMARIAFLRLLSNIFDKTGATNMPSLVTWARRQSPGDQRQVERC
jgi:hypothetical protein